MANVSSAWGTYTFNFSKTGFTPAQVKDFLTGLHDTLFVVTYGTYLDLPTDDAEYAKPILKLSFSGAGRWCYSNNLEWYTMPTNDFHQYLLKAPNLEFSVEYSDIEGSEYIQASAKLKVTDTTVIQTSHIVHSHVHDLCPKTYLEYELGEPYDAVSHFVDADELTDEQIDHALTLDYKDFWEFINSLDDD